MCIRDRYKGEPVPFVMELPNYRLPSAKSVGQLIWEKAKGFIQKAFTIIFAATLIVWFLQNFDAGLHLVSSADQSLSLIHISPAVLGNAREMKELAQHQKNTRLK